MRVLHCLDGLDRGGIETMLMNIFRNLDKHKVQFDFLLTNPNHCEYEDEVINNGGRVYRIPRLTYFTPWVYINGLEFFFNQHKDEWKIVHSHSTAKSALPLKIAKKYGVPVRIAHSHINKSETKLRAILEWSMRQILPHVVTHKFACSDDAAYYLFGKNIADVHIIKNAIDVEKFRFSTEVREKVRESLGVTDNDFVIGNIGRFMTQKNHKFVIEVFNLITRERPTSKLILIGEGPLENEIRSQVSELGLASKVIITGSVSNVNEYLQAMDVLLFPSLYEGLGMVLIEAQSAGIDCFASEYNVPSEADVTGLVKFLPLSDNAGYWAKTIIATDLNKDRLKYNKVVKNSGYDIIENAKRIQNFYLNCLQ